MSVSVAEDSKRSAEVAGAKLFIVFSPAYRWLLHAAPITLNAKVALKGAIVA